MNDKLREDLGALPTPRPTLGLRERIVSSRSTGARVALPIGDELRRPRVTHYAVAAAAVFAIVVVGTLLRSLSHKDEPHTDTYAFWWPGDAMAQQPEGSERYLASHPLAQLELSHFGAGRWVFQNRVIIDGFVTDTATTDTLRVAAADYHGTPAWRLSNRWGNRYFTARDTLLVTRDGLKPLRRAGAEGHPGRLVADLANAGLGPMLLTRVPPGYTGSRLHRFMRPALGLLNYLYLKPVIQALPVHDGWKGSVYVSGFGEPIPLDVRVVGRERQTVPAGTFDCWKLELRVPSNSAKTTVWISTEQRWIVRLRETLSDGALEQVLVSAGGGA